MNDYLKLFKKKKKDEWEGHKKNLEKFEKWLECKDCVNNATMTEGCLIKTLPPQSEVKIEFNNSIIKVADVLCGENLAFNGFHQ